MRRVGAFCFFQLITLALVLVRRSYSSAAPPPQIINLDPVALNEEQSYENFLVYNFNQHLAASSTYRLEILTSSSPNHTITRRFRLVDSTVLHFTGVLDREALVDRNECETDEPIDSCIIRLKIALYNNESSLVSLFVLPVIVADINDQRPKFKSNLYYLNVSENLPARTSLPLEMPVDLDSEKFNVKECHLLSNNTPDYQFDVFFSQLAKSLNLIINSPLDRENKSSYSFALICSDGRFKARTQLALDVLDANDNLPTIRDPKLNVSVNENTVIDRLIQLEAYDLDDPKSPNAKLVFSLPPELNSNELRRVFEIDRETGWVSLREPLDYERAKKYVLKIRVEDEGVNSVPVYGEVLVTVLDANDNPPTNVITYSDSYVLAENRTNRTIWIHEEIEASASSPVVLAYMTLSDQDSPLLNGHSLSASLLSIRYLNATSLEIQTESANSTPSFQLKPIIAQYGNYYYALQITRRLDCEKTSYFDLTIRMSDNEGGASDSKTSYFDLRVILSDLNDNYPEFRHTEAFRNDQGGVKFEYYKFKVPENQLTMNFGRVDAVDPDKSASNRIDFKILEENNPDLLHEYAKYVKGSEIEPTTLNPNYLFFINPENGTLSLRAELDREQKESYLFTVRVNDTQHISDILVEVEILDVNDNQPGYETDRVEFNLGENRGENVVVGSVKAADPDSNPFTEYFIEPYEMNRYFYVEPESGNLMTKSNLDAEDVSLPLTVNNTFEMIVYARDPTLLNASNVDIRTMAKLNVSVRLDDVNDNRPVVRHPGDNLIKFDMNRYANSTSSCQNMNLVLKTLETVDLDRGADPNQPHFYKFAYIRRLSWQFVYEIVKSEMSTNSSLSNQSQVNHELLKFIESLILVQNKYDIRPVTKVNLRSVFLLDQQADRRVLNQVNVTLNQLCKLNWGVYNLSVVTSEETSSSSFSDYSLKMFVFNSFYDLSINITDSHLELLNNLIEDWWAANSHLIIGLKRRIEPPNSTHNKPNSDDNGDYIDGITQEYFKFYASSAFSRFGSGRQPNPFWDITNMVVFKSASNSIILIIAVFLAISILLILFISYKQYRAASKSKTNELKRHLTNGHSPGTKKSAAFLNVSISRDKSDSSSSTSSSDAASSGKQSTKDLTSSPDMVASKINNKKISISTLKTSSTSSSSSNLILYPGQQQPQKFKNSISSASNNNPSNEQNSRYVKCEQPSASICDSSFTVITSLTTAATAETAVIQRHGPIPESPESSTPPAGTSTTTVYIAAGNVTSTPTVLSTFSPLPSSSTPPDAMCKLADQGYYGSSDYSENNSFIRHSNYSDGVYMRNKSTTRAPVVMAAQKPIANPQQPTNSTSSFASSSLMSSPSSSTDSYSSEFTGAKPAVTNLYPVYQANFKQDAGGGANPADVKIYLEKFERIYNSDSQGSEQKPTPLNTFNKQRNSMTTYSYV